MVTIRGKKAVFAVLLFALLDAIGAVGFTPYDAIVPADQAIFSGVRAGEHAGLEWFVGCHHLQVEIVGNPSLNTFDSCY